jgi:hypothetical protein
MKMIVLVFACCGLGGAHAADLDAPYQEQEPGAHSMSPCGPPGPPPVALRAPGRPPAIVFYAPAPFPQRPNCLPGFFVRVYPDGNSECFPWAN